MRFARVLESAPENLEALVNIGDRQHGARALAGSHQSIGKGLMISIGILCSMAWLLLTAVQLAANEPPHFNDLTVQAGIGFQNISGTAQKQYIIESQSAGVGFWDYDNDGDLDLYFTNGTTLEDSITLKNPKDTSSTNRLYRNDGDGSFTDLTAASHLGVDGWNMGCTMADYDNDGDLDLYITRWGANRLYRNDGGGSFTDCSQAAGVADTGWGIGCAFGDYDDDGDLDLYVANYIDFRLHGPPYYDRWCNHNGIQAACGPKGFPAQPDVLYRNEGDGTFSDQSVRAGLNRPPYYGMGVTWTDLDGDRDLDLYVANDGHPNNLYRNDGQGHFSDTALLSGVAFSGTGRAQAGMGVALGDYDNDARPDIFVTNFSQDHNTLYHNEGNLFFVDRSGQAGLSGNSRPFMGWGTFFFDYDNDGDLDLFVANGHLMPAIDQAGVGLSYKQRNQLYRNDDNGTFTEVSQESGPGLQLQKISRGAAAGDYDNDGDVDIVVANLDAAPSLLRNDIVAPAPSLQVRLRGVTGNLDAIGAQLKATMGSRIQYRQIQSGTSFQAQNDLRVHFGLGQYNKIDQLEIRWPGGQTQTLKDLSANQFLLIEETSQAP